MREWAINLGAKPKHVVSSTRADFAWTNSHRVVGDLPSTRRLDLISAEPLRSGAVAMHYRRAP